VQFYELCSVDVIFLLERYALALLTILKDKGKERKCVDCELAVAVLYCIHM
jgi:hypothetical protein